MKMSDSLEVIADPTDHANEIELASTTSNIYYKVRNSNVFKPMFDMAISILYRVGIVPSSLRARVTDIMDSAYYKEIPKVSDAGKIVDGSMIMHNGVRVLPNSYYGQRLNYLFRKTKGIHEPTEEFHFMHALEALSETQSPVMVELGSYWAFYSIWFKKLYPNGNAVLVEPNESRMNYGVRNFKLNDMNGSFIAGYAGETNAITESGIRVFSLPGVLAEASVYEIDILHADIQGAEYDLLKGSIGLLEEKKIKHVFLSTHSDELHESCVAILEQHGYRIVESMPLDGSDSVDGFIYAISTEHIS